MTAGRRRAARALRIAALVFGGVVVLLLVLYVFRVALFGKAAGRALGSRYSTNRVGGRASGQRCLA